MTSEGGEVQHSGRVHYSRRMYVRAHGMMDVLRRGNLAALLLPLALLGLGAVARARLTRKTVVYRWHGVELAHPSGWTEAERSAGTDGGESVVLTDLLGPGRIKPRLTLRITPAPSGESGGATPPATDAAPDRGTVPDGATPDATPAGPVNRLPLYYEIGSSQVQVGSITATRIDAAFAFTPRAVPGRKGDIPVVMRSIDFVVLRGTDALSIQLAAPIEDFEAQRPVLEGIVGSLRLDPAAGPPPAAPAPANEAEPVAAEGASDAVTVTGQVVDAESGLAVPGAIVVFLAPGTGVDDVDDDNLTNVAYTTGLADSEGHFASTRPLSRAAHYAVMVVADGYRWIGSDDGVTVGGEAPEPLDVGAVRLRRR